MIKDLQPNRLERTIEELCDLGPNELADKLLEWEPMDPDGIDVLLRAAAKTDRSALHFAKALVQLLTTWTDGRGPWVGVDDVLLRAFPKLESPERDWVAERDAIREKYQLVPGKDFIAMGQPSAEDQWPKSKPLPPVDSVRGVQARLLRAGYNCGPITGEWNDATRRALWRYQVERAVRASGELDEPTRMKLADEE